MQAQFDKVRDVLRALLAYNAEQGAKVADHGATVYYSARFYIVVAIGLAALLCAACGLLIVATVSRPITRMTSAMRQLADHHLTAQIEGVGQTNEIGRMAEAVQVFKDNMARADALAANARPSSG
ncbi:MAG: HAMP domain-containing protein [Pseudomonadota bacterium]